MNIKPEYIQDDNLIVKPLESKVKKQDLGIDPNLPQHPFLTYIFSMRGSGKTTLIQWLLLKYKNVFHKIFYFCPTLDADGWDHFKIENEKICSDYTDKKFDEIINEISTKSQGLRCLIVIDDMSGSAIYKPTSSLARFSYIHRHKPSDETGTSILFVSHKYKQLVPGLRSNMTDLIFFHPSSETELDQIAEDNADGLDKKFFKNMIRECTAIKYNFFYIKRSEPIEKRFRCNFNVILNINKFTPLTKDEKEIIKEDVKEQEESNQVDKSNEINICLDYKIKK
jgi:hypothetical protein